MFPFKNQSDEGWRSSPTLRSWTKDTWDATRYYVYEVSSICVNRYYWIWCPASSYEAFKEKKSWYAFKYLRNVKRHDTYI